MRSSALLGARRSASDHEHAGERGAEGRGDERLRAAFGEQRARAARSARAPRRVERGRPRGAGASGERPARGTRARGTRRRPGWPARSARVSASASARRRARPRARAPSPIARPRSNGTRLESRAIDAPSANHSAGDPRGARAGKRPAISARRTAPSRRSSRAPRAAAGRAARRARARAASRRAGGGRRTRSCPTA